jgi:ribulose 1,5-bisphosphate synthetase/thiazole synthase
MKVADERSTSYWMKDVSAVEASPLKRNAECDVVVIGSGISGLSTAFELTRFCRTVIVMDRGMIRSWPGFAARTRRVYTMIPRSLP